MSWRDRLRPASLRGVGFFLEAAESAGGRRAVVHEYPLRDEPYTEDLGRRARGFQLYAYLVGESYDIGLKALIAALELPGPATLVHPYLGTSRVQVLDYRVRHSTRDGGMARVQITCVEAGQNLFPSALLDTLSGVFGAVATVLDAVQSALALAYLVTGLPSWLQEAAALVLDGYGADVRTLGGRITKTTSGGAALRLTLDAWDADTATLAGLPAALPARLAGVVAALQAATATPWAAYGALRALWSWGADLPPVPGSTPNRIIQADNQAALVEAVRGLALASAIEQLARALDAGTETAPDFPRAASELRTLRATLVGELDARAAAATTDTLYTALADLRTAVARDLAQRAIAAPRLITVTPRQTLPVLVLAYQTLGDAALEDRILSRNRIRHPGFVPGGQALEVLRD